MEIILNCGDKINIPDGCKAEIKDGVITIEKKRMETPRFKDGDFVTSIGGGVMGIVYVYKDNNGDPIIYMHWDNASTLGQLKKRQAKIFRPATEDERQTIIAKMAEQKLRWNAEENRLERTIWRAKEGERYFTMNLYAGFSVEGRTEEGDEDDDEFHMSLNYFRTDELARKAFEIVRGTLKKFHEDYESNK